MTSSEVTSYQLPRWIRFLVFRYHNKVVQKQSMPKRNWCKSVNSQVHPRLYERFFLIIWNCTCYQRFVYRNIVSCCWSKSNVSLKKQSFESKNVTVISVLVQQYDCMIDSDVGTGDFSLVLETFTCVDTRTWDRTCLRVGPAEPSTLLKDN